MKTKIAAARRVGAYIALAASLLASIWSIALLFGSGFDTQVFGVRIRSNDALRSAVFAGLGFLVFWPLHRAPRKRSIENASWPSRLYGALPLMLILGGAALVRVWALTFGLPSLVCRPDEEAIASIAHGLYYGNLQTHVFTYPPLFMLVVAGAMRAVDVAQHILGMVDIHPGIVATNNVPKFLIARVLSAAAGIATVGVLFRVGTRLAGRRVGLASAAFLAFAFLHVRDSHFGVTDVPMTFILLLAFIWVVRLSVSGSLRDLIGAAIVSGLATATKYNAALILVPAAFAILTDPSGRPAGERLRRVGLFLIMMLLGFLVISPFSVVEPQQMIAELRLVSQHLAEGHGPDLGRGWTYHISTTLRYGLGLPLLMAGLAGLVMWLRDRARVGILVALFPLSYYAVAGSGYTVFTRHMQPVVPFLCLTAGYAVTKAAESLATALRRPAWTPGVMMLAVGIVLWPSVYAVVKFDQILARTDTRVLARRWIDANFPRGTTIAQRGPATGRAVTADDAEPPYVTVELTAAGPRPDLVIVQSSPLHGTDGSGGEPFLATEYDLRLTLSAAAPNPANVYDRQDDFYLPMSGFKMVERPGPNLRIYVRRGSVPP